MTRIACKDSKEASCLLANLLSELEQPCRSCAGDGTVVLCGTSPGGENVTVRMLPGAPVMEIEGVPEETLAAIRGRRCSCV